MKMKSKHLLLLCVLPLLFSALPARAQTVYYVNRTVFSTAAPDATTTFGFEEFSLGSAQAMPLGATYTPPGAGYVSFLTTSNYTQRIIDGFNVGQGTNDVYTTLAADKTGTIADITFGAGVFAVGFDLKNTASAGSTAGAVPQEFTINLFSGSTALGSFSAFTMVGGSLFSFAGFTSDSPITEITISSFGVSPNLDLVLDNFQLSAQVPEPGTVALAVVGGLGLFAAGRRRLKNRRA